VDARVQGLHAAAEHLGATGQRRHVEHRESGVAQRPGGAARCHELDAELGKTPGKLNEAGLV